MRFPSSRPVAKFAASIALAGTLGLSAAAAVAAQDATPIGLPIGPNACLAPTTTAPVMATPIGEVAPATPVGGVVVEDEAVIAEATEAIQNLYVCFNEGQGELFVALFTEQGREAAFGEGVDAVELADKIEAMSTMVQARDVTVNEVVAYDDGSLAVDYQVKIGKQVLHFLDTLVNQNTGAWLVDDREVLSPETDLDTATARVESTVEDGVEIAVSPSPIMNQPALRLQFINPSDVSQTMTLLQGGDAAAIDELDLTNLPEGVTFVGDAQAEPGERVDTLFEELEEGNYVIVTETAEGETGTFDLTIEPPFDPGV